ncbi:hypothetical protein [Bacillus sp. T33-2]|nr:hypothetical protein [Bacillus sp. T33-2]
MRWVLVILLSGIGILFLGKGIDLWLLAAHVDEDGIGVNFYRN